MVKNRLWRVDSIHKHGYNAPHRFLQTTEERLCNAELEAQNIAKQTSAFLGMPDWKIEVTQLDKRLLNGKWYSLVDYFLKTERKEDQ